MIRGFVLVSVTLFVMSFVYEGSIIEILRKVIGIDKKPLVLREYFKSGNEDNVVKEDPKIELVKEVEKIDKSEIEYEYDYKGEISEELQEVNDNANVKIKKGDDIKEESDMEKEQINSNIAKANLVKDTANYNIPAEKKEYKVHKYIEDEKLASQSPIKQYGIHLKKEVKNDTIKHNENGAIGGDFVLVDKSRDVFDTKEFKNKFKLIYFGYTFCPDVCPEAMENLKEAMLKLSPETRSEIEVCFITVDPERDTIEQMEAFSKNMPKNFKFLTGTRSDINLVLKQYKVYSKKQGEDENYLIDHTSFIYVMSKEMDFIGSFPYSIPGHDMASYVKDLIKTHG